MAWSLFMPAAKLPVDWISPSATKSTRTWSMSTSSPASTIASASNPTWLSPGWVRKEEAPSLHWGMQNMT
jgi:hypothetical protein